ncbi:MAG: hypothetical protein ACI91R_001541, partial [Vicingaceae bacterium]
GVIIFFPEKRGIAHNFWRDGLWRFAGFTFVTRY